MKGEGRKERREGGKRRGRCMKGEEQKRETMKLMIQRERRKGELKGIHGSEGRI